MNKQKSPLAWPIIVAGLFLTLILLPLFGILNVDPAKSTTQLVIDAKLANNEKKIVELDFHLRDPEQAPENIRETVMLGYHIILDTPKYAEGYSGNALSCTNCHFCAGNTTGGKNGSLSLAGIAAAYPDYNDRAQAVVTLPERINGCFKRSMNGSPLPLTSPEMKGLITYLTWISKGFPVYEPIPWRGLKYLKEGYTPNPENGEKIYAAKCALCHGANGQGQIRIPPVWGPDSFNEGAGMNKLEILATFIHDNMPYEDPRLTEEEAFDVAGFIKKQPRPEYPDKQ